MMNRTNITGERSPAGNTIHDSTQVKKLGLSVSHVRGLPLESMGRVKHEKGFRVLVMFFLVYAVVTIY